MKDQANGGSSNETRVLSQMCYCIQNNQTKLNGHIRRMFSLDQILMKPSDPRQFRGKDEMME